MFKFLISSFCAISFSHAMENSNLKPDSINEAPLSSSNKVIQPEENEKGDKILHNYNGINKKKHDQQGKDMEKLALKLFSELFTANNTSSNNTPNNIPNTTLRNDHPSYSSTTTYKVSKVRSKKN